MLTRKLHNLLHPKRGEVWMLHRVVGERSTDPAQRALEVTPQWLEQRIVECQARGWQFVPIGQLMHSRRAIAVTLDDGYRDNLTVALPLFRRLQVPFTVYVTTGFVGNRLPMWWYPGQALALSTDEVRTLAAEPLCTLGAHTVSHPHLSTLPPDAQQLEIETSKQQLETLIGRPVEHFSYPHGDYNHTTVDICRQLGFSTAVTTSGRTVRTDARPLELDRLTFTQPD